MDASVKPTPCPTVILPGLGNNTDDYRALQKSLEEREIPTYILPVRRIDWLRNAIGLLDGDWWKGKLRPRPILDWYLKRIEVVLEQVQEEHPNTSINLLGHSAGGWLARVYLSEFGRDRVRALVSLGTPHLQPPPGVLDQTRGLLTHVNEQYPGAFFDDMKYVSVAGKQVFGKKFREGTFAEWFVGQGYKQVCGTAETWGDSVVPLDSALLPGSLHLVLDDVYHSPVGATEVRPWYGSEHILEAWVQHLFEESE